MQRLTHHALVGRRRVDDISAVFYYSSSAILDQKLLVTRLFVGYSACLKALALLGFLAQIAVSTAYAASSPKFAAIPTQTVVAGTPFSYRIVVDSAATQPAGMRLINAPKGAALTDNGDGSHMLRWVPPADVGAQTIIIVQAFNIAPPNLISTQRVVLVRGRAEQVRPAAANAAAKVVVASNNVVGSRLLTNSNNTTVSVNAATAVIKAAAPASVDVQTDQSTPLLNSAESSSLSAANASPEPKVVPEPTVESLVTDRPGLPELGLQRLTVGEEFQFFIRPVVPDDAKVQLSAESLPVGASFEDVFEGSKMLRWKPAADQVGEHKMVLVLVAEDNSDLSLRTERDVIFIVAPAPPIELVPELAFEPISAQIVSAGRKVNIRVRPIATDNKIALLHVDRLPAGGSFDENKDGTRTFHWPTTQSDQGEHTFRFTAIHPDDAELAVSVNVLIVVGSPDGPGTGPNVVSNSSPSPSPEDAYPSAESPSPEAYPSAQSPSPEPNSSEGAPSPDQPSPSESAPSPDQPSPLESAPSPDQPNPSEGALSPDQPYLSEDAPSPEQPYPTEDTATPEPLAVRPAPQPRPSPD